MNAATASPYYPADRTKPAAPMGAGLLSMLAGPWLGFLYLGQVRLALFYAAYAVFVALGFTWLYLADLSYLAFMPYKFFYVLAVHVVGTLHCTNRIQPPLSLPQARHYKRLVLLLSAPVVVLSLCIFTLVSLSSHRMASTSMAPTIDLNAPFFLNTYAYRWSLPERGDVVLFTTPDRRGTITRVSRIIGLPGDRVAMRMGVPYVNGKPLAVQALGPYTSQNGQLRLSAPSFMETLPEGTRYRVLSSASPGTGRFDNHPERLVPEHAYFVIGDNRISSRDSRDAVSIGFVPQKHIKGKVFNFR